MRRSGRSRTSLRGQRSKTFLAFFLFFSAYSLVSFAQNDYKKLMHLSYAKLDSLSGAAYNKGAFGEAIPYMQAGREKAKTEFGEQDSIFAEYTGNLGFLYSQTGQYQQAEPLLLQAMAIRKKTLGELHPEYASSLNSLAILYRSMGNYDKAEPLFLQSKAILKKTLGELHPYYASSLNNLASLYDAMGNYDKAEPLYLETIAIRKKILGEQHPEYALSLNNLGALYQSMGDNTNAEQLYLEATAIWKKTLGEQHPQYAGSLNNLAHLYQSMGNYTKAEPLFLQSVEMRKKALGAHHPDYAGSLGNLAALYNSMGKLDTAFYYCRMSITANALTMDSSFADWGNLDTFTYASNLRMNESIRTLLSILQKQYNKTKDQKKLETRYAVLQAAIRLHDRFRYGFIAEGDKLRILTENNGFVLAAIKTGIALGKADYKAAAFGFAEMNKGVLLLESAKTTNAQQFGGLPDTLATQEKALQKKQSSLNAQLLQKRSGYEKDSLRKVLNGVNQDIDGFTNMLKNKYPKYAALKYDNKTATAKEIQALLDDKTALLEYVIGDSVVYIFYIDKNTIELVPQYIRTKDLADRIKNFHATLSNYELAVKQSAISYQKYTENAFWFYENLVAPALKNTKEITDVSLRVNRLIIVSDGELGHLPFEAFLTKAAPNAQQGLGKEADYRKLHYLSNDYKISYNYSATIWKSSKEVSKNKNNGQVLAMAANYASATLSTTTLSTKTDWRLPNDLNLREGLIVLPAAKKEVDMLASKFKGFFGFDKDASEKIFKEKAGDFAVIHLAMHGLLDNKAPILSSLAFTEDWDSLENNFLHAYEVSKMKLNADLVVLSACETGYGRFEKGNGIASLAQAFSYAGAPALIVSLWQVNDHATSEIMKNLYQNLADGMEKDEALQQAKIKFIQEAEGIAAHPAFWSPFILMGNTDAIYLKTKGGGIFWGIGGVIALVLGGGFLLSKRKKEVA